MKKNCWLIDKWSKATTEQNWYICCEMMQDTLPSFFSYNTL